MVLTILSLVSSENCVDLFTAKRIIYVKWTSVGCPVCVSYVVCMAIIVNQFQLSGALSQHLDVILYCLVMRTELLKAQLIFGCECKLSNTRRAVKKPRGQSSVRMYKFWASFSYWQAFILHFRAFDCSVGYFVYDVVAKAATIAMTPTCTPLSKRAHQSTIHYVQLVILQSVTLTCLEIVKLFNFCHSRCGQRKISTTTSPPSEAVRLDMCTYAYTMVSFGLQINTDYYCIYCLSIRHLLCMLLLHKVI